VDGGFRFDLEKLKEHVESADVICIHFPILRRTMIVDARYNDSIPPSVDLVPMASSLEERFAAIETMRPEFPKPESLTALPWPGTSSGLIHFGVISCILHKFSYGPHIQPMRSSIQEVLLEIKASERTEGVDAIKGSGYYPIWTRSH
ncbi:uncharacterized protein METZ01_LOCUS482529, partial [marine metagenome]